MALKKISGTVSHFREETEVTSARTSNYGHTRFRTEKQINFRIDNRPVSMKLPKGIELYDGDEATVIGTESGGGIKAVLVRNDATGITYGMSMIVVMIWAVLLTIAGIATLAMFIGLVLLPIGLFLLYRGYRLIQAKKMLVAA